MTPDDQKRWELAQLNELIDFDCEDIRIDPSPFQLVEKTPIVTVHRLFTILSLRRAYVTQLGRLVGVVGLKELRHAIEDANNGNLIMECIDHRPDVTHENFSDDANACDDSAVNDVERPPLNNL